MIPIIKLERYSVFQCPCGIKYLDPSLDEAAQIAFYKNSESLKEINPALEEYYEYNTLDPKGRTARDYTRALRDLEGQVKGRDLCEVGCGTGGFLAFSKSKKWNVFGIDSSSENILKTCARGVDALQINIFEYTAPTKFDVVVLWDVLEHPQEPGKLIAKCRELLKPGGRLLIAIPFDPNVISVLGRFIYMMSLGMLRGPVSKWYILEHTSYFSKKGLRGLLERHDLKIVSWWKTETDLSRYKFGFVQRVILKVLFIVARVLGLQNRLIAIAGRN